MVDEVKNDIKETDSEAKILVRILEKEAGVKAGISRYDRCNKRLI